MLLRLTIASILALTYLIVHTGATPTPAHACRTVEIAGDPHNRIDFAAEYNVNDTLVLIGTVIEETLLEYVHDPTTGVTTLQRISDPSRRGYDSGQFESKVRVEAILKGETSDRVLTLTGMDDDCFGGPRLHEGDRLLLVLWWTPNGFYGGPDPASRTWVNYRWRVGHLGSNILLLDHGAYLDDLLARRGRAEYLGPTEDTIRYVAARFDVSPRNTARAIDALTLSSARAPNNHIAEFALAAALATSILIASTAAALTRATRR